MGDMPPAPPAHLEVVTDLGVDAGLDTELDADLADEASHTGARAALDVHLTTQETP